jgi:lipopolysaccharide export system protein LptA
MCQIKKLLVFNVLLLLGIYHSIAFALDSDRVKEADIKFANLTHDYKNNTSVFCGDVQLDQGTTHLTADKLTTKSTKSRTLEQATAYGLNTLAHLWTIPNPGEPVLHAFAKVIKYYPSKGYISLQGNVTITQGKNSFKGETIHYDMNQKIITVPASNNNRSTIVYNPKS